MLTITPENTFVFIANDKQVSGYLVAVDGVWDAYVSGDPTLYREAQEQLIKWANGESRDLAVYPASNLVRITWQLVQPDILCLYMDYNSQPYQAFATKHHNEWRCFIHNTTTLFKDVRPVAKIKDTVVAFLAQHHVQPAEIIWNTLCTSE